MGLASDGLRVSWGFAGDETDRPGNPFLIGVPGCSRPKAKARCLASWRLSNSSVRSPKTTNQDSPCSETTMESPIGIDVRGGGGGQRQCCRLEGHLKHPGADHGDPFLSIASLDRFDQGDRVRSLGSEKRELLERPSDLVHGSLDLRRSEWRHRPAIGRWVGQPPNSMPERLPVDRPPADHAVLCGARLCPPQDDPFAWSRQLARMT